MSHKPFVVYKSSAGSGKTFTLARFFLKLVLKEEDPGYFRSILALTFTVKAAAEMKSRIVSYLSDISSGTQDKRKDTPFMLEALRSDLNLSDEAIKKRSKAILSAILHNYSDFQILTIDKFITRLTRSFASDLLLAPDFEIEIDHDRFTESVISKLFEELGSQPETTALVMEFLAFKLQEEDSGNVEHQLKEASGKPLSESFYFLEDRFYRFTPKEIFKLKDMLLEEVRKEETRISAFGMEALDLLERQGLSASDLAGGKNGIASLFRKVSEKDFEKISTPTDKWLTIIEEGKWKSSKGSEAVDSISSDLARLAKEILNQKDAVAELNLKRALLKEVFTLGFIGEVIRIGQEVREEENIQLLSDFNRLIAQQLHAEQSPFIFERLGNKVQHLLVDEFQDTSVLQWQNLLPLLENTLAEGKENLIVGDAKQSIYRFRGGDSSLFIDFPAVDHPSASLFQESYDEQRLGFNYRSAKAVVDFNNRFFEELIQRELDDSPHHDYGDLKQETTVSEEGKVRWWFNPYEPNQGKEPVMDRLIDRVVKLVRSGECNQGEICCLFRSNGDATECASRLLHENLDVISEESLLLKHNPSVQLLLASLNAVRSPKDPFTLQQWLAKYHHNNPLPDYHEKAMQLKTNKLDFRGLLHLLNLAYPKANNSNVFSIAFELATWLELNADDAFVSKFLDVCLDFESRAGYLQKSFSEQWKELEDKTSIELTSVGDAVRVMTIHKSKGLEFPVTMVFLPHGIKKSSKTTQETTWIELELGGQPAVVPVRTSDLKETPLEDLYEEERIKTHLDDLNVLYVALTRAQSQLEIFSNESSPRSENLKFLQNWPEWNEESYSISIG